MGKCTEEDDFWTQRLPLFTAQFPGYCRTPQKVLGKLHSSQENYTHLAFTEMEIIPLKVRRGTRTYVMMHSVIFEPKITLTVGLYAKPKQYADQEPAVGETIGKLTAQGFREVQVGSAQAWYYHEDRTIVLWECFFDGPFRERHLAKDANMRQLWRAFEQWLCRQFPGAESLATPFNDPIAETIEDYQAFLKALGYAPIAPAAFGKPLTGNR